MTEFRVCRDPACEICVCDCGGLTCPMCSPPFEEPELEGRAPLLSIADETRAVQGRMSLDDEPATDWGPKALWGSPERPRTVYITIDGVQHAQFFSGGAELVPDVDDDVSAEGAGARWSDLMSDTPSEQVHRRDGTDG